MTHILLIYLVGLLALVLGAERRGEPTRRLVVAPLLAIAWALAFLVAAAIVQETLKALHVPDVLVWAAAVLLLAGAGFLTVKWPGPAPSEQLQRGARVMAAPSRPSPPSALAQSGAPLTFAGVPVPAGDDTKHFKIIGTTGTGKSTAIAELLKGALARGDRAVLADPDGGYRARFFDAQRGDVILNPFDPRSRSWDLYAELRNPYDYDQMARALVGEDPGPNQVWHRYGQTFLAALLRQTHAAGVGDIAELYRLITRAPLEELRLMLDGTAARPFVEAGNEEMFGSIRSITTTQVAALSYLQTPTGTPFSIRRWVEEGSGVLFLPYQADQIAALRGLLSTWLRLAIFQTMSPSTPEADPATITGARADAKLWFVIDELDALAAIDGLKDALVRLRKFGGRCVLGFQAIAQVSTTYGDGAAQSIVENCGNTLILRCSASEHGGTAQFASRLIGDRELIRVQESRSRRPTEWQDTVSTGAHHVIEAAVLPSEIEQLPDLAGFLKLASTPSWQRVRIARN